MRTRALLLVLLLTLHSSACVHVCRCIVEDHEGGERASDTVDVEGTLEALGTLGKAALRAALSLL